jgi:hypothetical protein
MDETGEPPPGAAVLHHSVWPRPTAWRPGAAEQRFQADAVFVHRPQLDGGMREGRRHLPQERPQFFLKVSCSAGSAKAWRGRGTL